MWKDRARWTFGDGEGMAGAAGRIFGYTGAGGMIQGLAAGYFLWDLGVCIAFYDIFGFGLLLHAVAAFFVFSFGFVGSGFPDFFDNDSDHS